MSGITEMLDAVQRDEAQAAEILGLPERTAKRTWAYARAWLYEEMKC